MACFALTLFIVNVYILITCDSDEMKEKPIDWDHWEKQFSKKVDSSEKWSDVERYSNIPRKYQKGRPRENRFIRRNFADRKHPNEKPINWKQWEQAFDKSRGKTARPVRTTPYTMSPKELEVTNWLKQVPLEDHNRAYFETWAEQRRKNLNITESEEHNETEEDYGDYEDQQIGISHQSELVQNIERRFKRSSRKIEKYWNFKNFSGPVPTAQGVSLFYRKKNQKRAERLKYRSHIEMGKYYEKLELQKKEKEDADKFYKKFDKKYIKPATPSLVYSYTSDPDPEITTETMPMFQMSPAEENQFLALFLNETPKNGEDFLDMRERWTLSKEKFIKTLIKEMGNRTTTTEKLGITEDGNNVMELTSSRITSTVTPVTRVPSTAPNISILQQKRTVGPYKREAAKRSNKLKYCPICGLSFRGKYRLTQHMNSKSCLKRPELKEYFKTKRLQR